MILGLSRWIALWAACIGLPSVGAPLAPLPPSHPTQPSECRDYAGQWQAYFAASNAEMRSCQSRDGGTVKPSGVSVPNCDPPISQAYITCANLEDAICLARKQSVIGIARCFQQARATHDDSPALLPSKSSMQRTLDDYKRTRALVQNLVDRGFVATLLDQLGLSAAAQFDQLRHSASEAVRAGGTVTPDSNKTLADLKTVFDKKIDGLPETSSIAKEIAKQSGDGTMARLGDVLARLDGSLVQAQDEFSVSQLRPSKPLSQLKSDLLSEQALDALLKCATATLMVEEDALRCASMSLIDVAKDAALRTSGGR